MPTRPLVIFDDRQVNVSAHRLRRRRSTSSIAIGRGAVAARRRGRQVLHRLHARLCDIHALLEPAAIRLRRLHIHILMSSSPDKLSCSAF